jgi:hypothetical protein
MNVAQHAEQILAAWKQADATRFEEELDSALRSCERAKPANYMETEQREVLVSVVERLRTIQPRRRAASVGSETQRCTPQGLHAGFTLLEHLRQRSAA